MCLCLFKWVFWLRVFTFIYSFRSYAGLFAQVCSWLCLFANIRFAYHSSSYSILAKSEKTWILINYFYSMFLNATSAIRRLVLFEGPKWSDRLSWSYSIIHDLLLELIWSNRFFFYQQEMIDSYGIGSNWAISLHECLRAYVVFSNKIWSNKWFESCPPKCRIWIFGTSNRCKRS